MKWDEAVKALVDALTTEGWDYDGMQQDEVENLVKTLASFGFAVVQTWPEDFEIDQETARSLYQNLDAVIQT